MEIPLGYPLGNKSSGALQQFLARSSLPTRARTSAGATQFVDPLRICWLAFPEASRAHVVDQRELDAMFFPGDAVEHDGVRV